MTKTIEEPLTALVPTNGPAALQLAFELGADLSATGLEITKADLTYAEWENIGRGLFFVGNAYQWWVGDWLNFGELLFGEESAQAVDDHASRFDVVQRITGRAPGTLQNIASTCAKVAKSRRRPELDFGHHVEVQNLDPEEQVEWLERAAVNSLGRNDLRQAIRDAKAPPRLEPPDGEPPESQVTPSERIQQAANLVVDSAQPTTDGSYLVYPEPWAQLLAALGREN